MARARARAWSSRCAGPTACAGRGSPPCRASAPHSRPSSPYGASGSRSRGEDMSRSPKYAQARLAQERQREIERRRRAREEERRGQQAEARRRRDEARRAQETQAAAAERDRAKQIAGDLAEAISGIVRERTAAGLPGDPETALGAAAALLARDLHAGRHADVI